MIAIDENGKVLLIGDALPTESNGIALTLHELTDEQQAAYDALPSDRSGATFDGNAFTALPAEESGPPAVVDPVTKLTDFLKANPDIRALVTG